MSPVEVNEWGHTFFRDVVCKQQKTMAQVFNQNHSLPLYIQSPDLVWEDCLPQYVEWKLKTMHGLFPPQGCKCNLWTLNIVFYQDGFSLVLRSCPPNSVHWPVTTIQSDPSASWSASWPCTVPVTLQVILAHCPAICLKGRECYVGMLEPGK